MSEIEAHIVEEGRKSKSTTHADDVKYITSKRPNLPQARYSAYINLARHNFLKALEQHGVEASPSMSLLALDLLCKKNNINLDDTKHVRSSSFIKDKQFMLAAASKDISGMSNAKLQLAINAAKKKYIAALRKQNVDIENAAAMSLEELALLASKHNAVLTTQGKRNIIWKDHEKEISDGLNSLFLSGFFKAKHRGSSESPVKQTHFEASLAGGSFDK